MMKTTTNAAAAAAASNLIGRKMTEKPGQYNKYVEKFQ